MGARKRTLLTFVAGCAAGIAFTVLSIGTFMALIAFDSELRDSAMAEAASATIEQWSKEDVTELWGQAEACWQKRQTAPGPVPDDQVPERLRALGFEVSISETGLRAQCSGSPFGVTGVQILFFFKSATGDGPPFMNCRAQGMEGYYDPVLKTWTFQESNWQRC